MKNIRVLMHELGLEMPLGESDVAKLLMWGIRKGAELEREAVLADARRYASRTGPMAFHVKEGYLKALNDMTNAALRRDGKKIVW